MKLVALNKFRNGPRRAEKTSPATSLLLANNLHGAREASQCWAQHFSAGIHTNINNTFQRSNPKVGNWPPEAAPAWSGRFPPWTAVPSSRERERPENAGERREGWGRTRAATEMGTAASWSPLPPSSDADNLDKERERLNYLSAFGFRNLVGKNSQWQNKTDHVYIVRCSFEIKMAFKSLKYYLIHQNSLPPGRNCWT